MVARREKTPTEVLLYDLEIERAVLGFCLVCLEAFEQTVDLLQPESFYLAAHQRVYDVCVALYHHGDAVDQDTVANELRRRRQLGEAGGVEYLTQLASTTETWDDWEGHAQAVADYALRRRLLALSDRVTCQARDLAVQPKQAREELQAGLAELQQGYDGPGLRPFAEAMATAKTRFAESAQQERGLTGVATSLQELDRLTGGWQASELIVVGARPGMGKTTLARQWAEQAARSGQAVAYFGLEMVAHELASGYLCWITDLDLERLRTGRWGSAAGQAITPAASAPAALPLWIDDRDGQSPLELRAACRRLQREEGLGLVIVGPAQRLRAPECPDDQESEAAAIARALKRLAKELAVPVIVLSELVPTPENRRDRRPCLADLGAWESLAEAADLVLLLDRPEIHGIETVECAGQRLMTAGLVELFIAKQRYGLSGSSLWLRWVPAPAWFEECLFVEPKREVDG